MISSKSYSPFPWDKVMIHWNIQTKFLLWSIARLVPIVGSCTWVTPGLTICQKQSKNSFRQEGELWRRLLKHITSVMSAGGNGDSHILECRRKKTCKVALYLKKTGKKWHFIGTYIGHKNRSKGWNTAPIREVESWLFSLEERKLQGALLWPSKT